jgi:thiamine-monophosphate kinase
VPQPRNAIADALRAHASAAMDVSDGLVGDLTKLCRASGVTAEIDVARVPLSPAARRALETEPKLIETILTGGDDYEVLLTMRSRRVAAFRKAAAAAGVAVTEIGTIVQGEASPRFLDWNGKPLGFARPSFSHF